MFRLLKVQWVLLAALGSYLLFLMTGKEAFWENEQVFLGSAHRDIIDAGLEEADPSEFQVWFALFGLAALVEHLFGLKALAFLLF